MEILNKVSYIICLLELALLKNCVKSVISYYREFFQYALSLNNINSCQAFFVVVILQVCLRTLLLLHLYIRPIIAKCAGSRVNEGLHTVVEEANLPANYTELAYVTIDNCM